MKFLVAACVFFVFAALPAFAQFPAPRAKNFSARVKVPVGETVTVGLVMRHGSESYFIRAVGPTLARFGVAEPMADPVITVRGGRDRNIHYLGNDDWSPSTGDGSSAGAFPLPPGSKDAVTHVTFGLGEATIEVGSATGAGGEVLLEIYEARQSAPTGSNTPRMVNFSLRMKLPPGDSITLGLVVVDGTRQFLVRAVGPTLARFGVPAPMADPRFTVWEGSTILHRNDDWDPASFNTAIAVGAFSLLPGSKDAAVLVGLSPGASIVQAGSADGGGGELLVELYEF